MEIEKIVLKGISKDISPRGLDAGGNRLLLNPLIDAKNCRYHTSETGELESVQNIPGTVGYSLGLPAGTNLVIGTFTDVEKGRLIFFNWNSNNDHGVYSWDPITKTTTTLIINSLLNFSSNPRYRITGVGIAQDLLYWTDGLNPQRMINMTRSYTGITDKGCINMYARPPILAPEITGSGVDATYNTSAIAGNIYQFASRYNYKDKGYSPLSRWSEVFLTNASMISEFDINRITIQVAMQTSLQSIIDSVQLLYRKNNSPDWFVYKDLKTSDFTSGLASVNFYDDNSNIIVPQNESNKIFDSIPIVSKALALFNNRNFLISDIDGYGIDQSQDFTVNKTIGGASGQWLKDGGNYSYGPVYYDEEMRTPGVNKFVKLSVNYQPGDASSGSIDMLQRTTGIPAFLDNNHPSWAKYVGVARTKDQNYAKYMLIPVKPIFYVAEGDLKNAAGTTIAIPVNMEKYNNGKVYLKVLPDNTTVKFTHLHLQVPESIPFLPDSSCLVRLITPLTGVTDQIIAPILSFDGQVIVCNNFSSAGTELDWSASGFDARNAPYFIWIEVFKPIAENEKPFYELPYFSEFPVGTFTRKDFEAMDANTTYKFKNLKIDGNASDVTYSKDQLASPGTSIESPTQVITRVTKSEEGIKTTFETTGFDKIIESGGGDSFFSQQIVERAIAANSRISRVYDSSDSKPSFIPDYRRIPEMGRRIAYNANPEQLNRKTTIRYSNPYIQDSNVNGLSNFEFSNEYALPTFRTPVTKLQSAGNVLLAIHERTTTSLYINTGVIQDTNGNLQVVKTDRVIGDDREFETKFGTYHPESVAEWGSIVFGFDIFKGVVWMYDNNGQIPVSDYGMKVYFKQKADKYLPEKDNVAILGGIDPYHKEYLITFPAITGEAAETWAFNFVAKQWTARMDFIPDAYGYINNYLLSFKTGSIWVHNQDSANCNTFYGTKYDRSITFAVNPYPSRVKNFAAMQISAEELCEGDRYTTSASYANLAAFPGTGVIGTKYTAADTGKIYRWTGSAYSEIRETVIVTCANREGQSTYMKRKEFDKLEGVFYTPILKDTNTADALMQAGRLKLRDGKDMISQVLEVTVTNNSRTPARHHYSNVTYVHSKFSI